MAAGLLLGLLAVFEDWKSEVSGACFLGVDSSDHLGVVLEGLLGLEGALVAGDPLADDLGVLVDPDVSAGGEEVLTNFAKHEISLLFTIINSRNIALPSPTSQPFSQASVVD